MLPLRRKYSRALPGISRVARLSFSSGALESLKWFALLLMTGDHLNTVLYHGALPLISEAARVCFPVFAFVLVYNLLRPGIDARRAMVRLCLFGAIAQPWHALAFGYMVPLNVLFTLALGVFVCTTRNRWLMVLGFFVGGLFVDYQWAGLLVLIAAFEVLTSGRRGRALVLVALVLSSLWFVNGNFYALLALPMIVLASRITWTLPRSPWAFYVYYPAHLAVLAAIQVMGN